MHTQALFSQDPYLRECTATVVAVDEHGITLDRTVFYPLGGGQAADTGMLRLADGSTITIADARKSKAPDALPTDVVHVPTAEHAQVAAALMPGTQVTAVIDWDKRYAHMRLHTSTHLLCKVVPVPVDGCSISQAGARMDMVTTDALDKDAIEAALNQLVTNAHPVTTRWISDDELRANPQLVKSMSVTPPLGFGQVRLVQVQDVDLQPCGGTHVHNTSEIGVLKIVKIEKKSAKTRRITITLD